MITFNEALNIVMKKYSNFLIRLGFEFEENFYFHVSPGKKNIIKHDAAAFFVIVDKNTKAITFMGSGDIIPLRLSDPDRLDKLLETFRSKYSLIDIDEKQYDYLYR